MHLLSTHIYIRVCKCVLKVNANEVFPYQYGVKFLNNIIIILDPDKGLLRNLEINLAIEDHGYQGETT